jgi:uncharacterized protein YndB with AHSA1/START domain
MSAMLGAIIESMLSDLQRQRVWEAWLSAEIRANYFAELSGYYHRLQRALTWLTLLLAARVG